MVEVISITQAIAMFRAARVTNLPRAMRLLGRNVALDVIREAVKNVSTPSVQSGINARIGVLAVHTRTGRLRRYVAKTLTEGIHDIATGVETGLPSGDQLAKIAWSLETGNAGRPIRPKRGIYLRIPLPPARRGRGGSGADKFEGVDFHMAQPWNPRLFPITSKSGKHFLAAVIGKGKNARLEPWYSLVRQVVIRPRYWFRSAVTLVQSRLHQHINAVMPQVFSL